MVDLSDLQSIDMAGTWRHDIINNVYLSDDSELINQNKNQTEIKKSLPILLVGSKLDKVQVYDPLTIMNFLVGSNDIMLCSAHDVSFIK